MEKKETTVRKGGQKIVGSKQQTVDREQDEKPKSKGGK